jgi:hypothetical protein
VSSFSSLNAAMNGHQRSLNLTGQRRREKIAALEAQAKGIQPPPQQVETPPIELDQQSLLESGSDVTPDERDLIQEVVPPNDDVNLSIYDFSQDHFDTSLLEDLNSTHSSLTSEFRSLPTQSFQTSLPHSRQPHQTLHPHQSASP